MRALAAHLLTAFAVSCPVFAQGVEVPLPRQLHSPSVAAYDIFGCDVAVISDTQLFVGLRGADQFGENGGAVERFERTDSGWLYRERLAAPGIAPGDQLGESVGGGIDTSGSSWVFAAATRHDAVAADAGAVLAYRLDLFEWKHAQTIVPTGGAAGARFGSAIAHSGDLLAVGAPAQGGGSVRIYARSGGAWLQVALLQSPSVSPFGRFGEAVSISNDRVFVGDPGDDSPLFDGGALHVYAQVESGWALQQTLRSSQPELRGNFGQAVAAHGSTLVVGAPGASVSGPTGNPIAAAGRAEIFTVVGGQFSPSSSLAPVPDQAIVGANFGWRVGVEKNIIVAGSPGAAVVRGDNAIERAGIVGVYRRAPSGSAWNSIMTLRLADAAPSEVFGASLSFQGGRLAIGAPGAQSQSVVQGTAHVFRIDTDCDADQLPDEIEVLLGADDCNGNGVPDACDVDANANGVPDDCECAADLSGDGAVSSADLAAMLTAWGDIGQSPADLTGDQQVNAQDVAALLSAWGSCQ
jgi:hypothetical protein